MRAHKQVPLLKDITPISEQCYWAMTGIEGSWLYEVCFHQLKDDAWCENFMKHYVDQYGWDDQGVQGFINEAWHEVQEYKASLKAKKLALRCAKSLAYKL